jgi:hypothetical protein
LVISCNIYGITSYFSFTGNKKNAWALLISQEIEKKCMGFIGITGNKGLVLLISQEIRDGYYWYHRKYL